jgi:hypothetical protein
MAERIGAGSFSLAVTPTVVGIAVFVLDSCVEDSKLLILSFII